MGGGAGSMETVWASSQALRQGPMAMRSHLRRAHPTP